MRRVPLLVLALAAAAPAPAQQSERAYFYEDIFTPFFAKSEAEGVYRSRRPGAAPGEFSVRKSSGALRVFVLGDSTAFSYMMGEDSLGPALRAALPGREVEAVNCGMNGYDSPRAAMILDEVLGYEPDLVVFIGGHTEGNASPPVPLWRLRAQDRTPGLDGLRETVERLKRAAGKGDGGEAAALREKTFEANLRVMVRRAKARGVPVLLVSPPLNYRDAAPGGLAPTDEPAFLEGWTRFRKQDFRGALDAWRERLERGFDPAFASQEPFFLFMAARAHDALGRAQDAARGYDSAADADWRAGGRCGPRCLRLIQRVAREEGALWADADASFRRFFAPGRPGLGAFYDSLHWRRAFDALVSDCLVEALRRAPAIGGQPWGDERLARTKTRRGAGARLRTDEAADTMRHAVIEINILEQGFSPADRRLSWRALIYLDALLRLAPELALNPKSLVEQARVAAPILGRAWSMPPLKVDDALLYWHIGEALLLRPGGAARALASFDEALAADPALDRLRASRAAALASAGKGPGNREEAGVR
jgi:hypothetical protein